MKGNINRIILGLVALGGISCQTLGLEEPKGVGEPTAIGQPAKHHDVHLSQLEAPIKLINGSMTRVAVASGRVFQVLDAIGFNSGSVGGSYGSGSCAVGSGASGGCAVGGGH